ncbi:hypothetical protein C5C36_06485 [Rathayibacter sp. AY1G1]|uniref:hypothetical protein n=1 Tax=unclassified Rathayibacter TaxID=2609250 RepID=UPI000CE8B322|nr:MULTISPECIES: hypothetical protein [unclassified Rathayibacter]PPH14216.1 hypothetical protein C5C36_06485 [Rathayibacter sp. AY1G1]PPH16347.1 hypothetical protein C5C35_10225 [Rathayibacter sp. AY1F8]
MKRLFDQVFLARVLVHADETITVELNEPFATIASTAVQLAAHEEGTTRKSGARTLTSFLEAEIGAVPAFSPARVLVTTRWCTYLQLIKKDGSARW